MRAEAKPRRRIWPWILIAILAISATIIGVSIATGTWGRNGNPTSTPTTSSPSPSESGSAGEPSGCLGGPERDAAMLLAASDAASHDETGAVEVATAFVRWIQRYPYPTADEAATVQKSVLTDDSFTDDLVGYLAGEPDLSGGIVAPATTYYMSTVPGVWYVESFDGDDATVSVGSGFVINGELSTTLRSSITVTLAWDEDHWRVAGADGARTTANLFQIGTDFKEGC